jgi:hypothetical protein
MKLTSILTKYIVLGLVGMMSSIAIADDGPNTIQSRIAARNAKATEARKMAVAKRAKQEQEARAAMAAVEPVDEEAIERERLEDLETRKNAEAADARIEAKRSKQDKALLKNSIIGGALLGASFGLVPVVGHEEGSPLLLCAPIIGSAIGALLGGYAYLLAKSCERNNGDLVANVVDKITPNIQIEGGWRKSDGVSSKGFIATVAH